MYSTSEIAQRVLSAAAAELLALGFASVAIVGPDDEGDYTLSAISPDERPVVLVLGRES